MTELLVVLLLMGLVMGGSAAAWKSYRRATNTRTSAQTVRMAIHQARLLAIFNGVSHFVAIDPANRTVGVYEDRGLPASSFDAADVLITETRWESGVDMALPPGHDPASDGRGQSGQRLGFPDAGHRGVMGYQSCGPDGHSRRPDPER